MIFHKNKWKAVSRWYYVILIKVVAVRHSKLKVFQKQTLNLNSTIYLLLRCSTEKQNIKTTYLISLTFFLLVFQTSFLSILAFSSFFVFCISSSNSTSHRKCSVKKGVLSEFAKFTRKHLCQSLFLNKVAGLRPAILLKKSLWHKCFPVNFAKFLRTTFLQNTSR